MVTFYDVTYPKSPSSSETKLQENVDLPEQIDESLLKLVKPSLSKETSSKELRPEAIKATKELISSALEYLRHTMEIPTFTVSKEPLSSKEAEVLILLGRGFTNNQIAEHLSINLKTIKSRLDRIYKKLPIESRTQAALIGQFLTIEGEAPTTKKELAIREAAIYLTRAAVILETVESETIRPISGEGISLLEAVARGSQVLGIKTLSEGQEIAPEIPGEETIDK